MKIQISPHACLFFFYDSYPSEYEMLSHCGSDLHFTNT